MSTTTPIPGATAAAAPRVSWPAVERGGGLPLVFLHGYPLNHTMWLPLLESLPTGIQAALLDLPGYGLAEDWPIPETLTGFSESVHRGIAERFRGPVVLVGHSFGGYLALQLYHDHPDQFRGLVLTNTRSGADSPQAREKRLATVRRLEDPSQTLDIEATARSLLAPRTWGAGGPAVEAARSMVQSARSPAIRGSLKAMAGRPDLTPVLATIRVPSLVIWGEEDQLIDPAETKAMAAQIPDASGQGIPGAGHLPSLESPGQFSRALHGLLLRVTSR
jgi:pimeloyl-ACP methyl ester carboxylesterase